MEKIKHRIPYNNWIHSQLSVARHYGGVTIQNKKYIFDPKCVYIKNDKGEEIGKPDLITYDN